MTNRIITSDELEKQRFRRERLKDLYSVKERPTTLPPVQAPDEHFHVLYEGVPDFNRIYLQSSAAYWEVKRLGDACEPNVEWYEDGRVMIETKLPGRTGLHRIMLEVAACVHSKCRARLNPEPMKAVTLPPHDIENSE